MKLRMSQGEDAERFRIEDPIEINWKTMAIELAVELKDTIVALHHEKCTDHSEDECIASSWSIPRYERLRQIENDLQSRQK